MTLWIIFACLTLVTIAVLLVPIYRRKSDISVERSSFDIAVYKDQLAEVERELARNIISAEEAESTRFDIQKRILAAAEEKKNTPAATRPKSTLIILFGTALVPLFSLLLYLDLGSPTVPDFPLAARTDIQETAGGTIPSMEEIIPRLQEHLAQNPDDLEGLSMLARSLMSIEDYVEAAAVHYKIYEITGDLQNLSDYAETSLLSNEMMVTPDILQIFKDISATDPLDPRSRFYIGLASLQEDNVLEALQQWVDLRHVSPAGAPWLPALEQQISETATNAEINSSAIVPSASAQDLASTITFEGPSAADVENAASMSKQDQNEMIKGMVQNLADRLAESPDDVEGWTKLERAYTVLGELDKAAEAARMIQKYSN